MNGVSFLVALSVLWRESQVSLILARSTLGIDIHEAEYVEVEVEAGTEADPVPSALS